MWMISEIQTKLIGYKVLPCGKPAKEITENSSNKLTINLLITKTITIIITNIIPIITTIIIRTIITKNTINN